MKDIFLNRYAASKNRAFLDDENFNQGKQLAKFAKGVSQQQKSLGIQLDNVNKFEEVTKEFNDVLKEKIRKQEELKNAKKILQEIHPWVVGNHFMEIEFLLVQCPCR